MLSLNHISHVKYCGYCRFVPNMIESKSTPRGQTDSCTNYMSKHLCHIEFAFIYLLFPFPSLSYPPSLSASDCSPLSCASGEKRPQLSANYFNLRISIKTKTRTKINKCEIYLNIVPARPERYADLRCFHSRTLSYSAHIILLSVQCRLIALHRRKPISYSCAIFNSFAHTHQRDHSLFIIIVTMIFLFFVGSLALRSAATKGEREKSAAPNEKEKNKTAKSEK